MPALDDSGRTTSFFGFWPIWLVYLQVAIHWLLLAVLEPSSHRRYYNDEFQGR